MKKAVKKSTKKAIKGHIRAAYIFDLLPNAGKSVLGNKLSSKESKKMDTGLGEIENLSEKEKKRILKIFIKNLNLMEQKRQQLMDSAIIYSLLTLSIVIVASFLYGLAAFSGINKRVSFIEAILNSGGTHIIFFPLLAGYARAKTSRPVWKTLFESKNFFIDFSLGLVSAFFIAAPFIFLIKGGSFYSSNIIVKVFTLVVAVTVVPAGEELFFRFLLFLRGGKKYGFGVMAVVSTLLFAAVHMPETAKQFALFCAAGALFCGLAFARKSLLPSLIAHSVSNLLIMLI
ncbi:MAG: CPBP family intramembrane metalloprotease [bacterium]|nr:CPBP family intramembrane metalloprotease [bacterium]